MHTGDDDESEEEINPDGSLPGVLGASPCNPPSVPRSLLSYHSY